MINAGEYILCWLRNSFRAVMNPSLNFSIDAANMLGQPAFVLITPGAGFASLLLRQYSFMMEGIAELSTSLAEKGIAAVIRMGDAAEELAAFGARASVVVTDSGYLRHEREMEKKAFTLLSCPFVTVESSTVVPLRALPGREEYSAATLRPRISRILHLYLNPAPDPLPRIDSTGMSIKGAPESMDMFHGNTIIDEAVPVVEGKRGGYSSARSLLDEFINTKLMYYGERRNDPSLDATSGLSPYLHSGQISPVEVTLSAMGRAGEDAHVFIDELVIRRELAFNFVRYNENYDSIRSIPRWAMETLAANEQIEREYIYTLDQFEKASTHDPYWNAAQKQLVTTGVIHNYMRMYWGKKIIQWTPSPEKAYEYMVYLNNRYALDGNDPNSYGGIAWCFGKHDRPWASRPVFGKVRYMNDRGLLRKFDMKPYLEKYPAP